MNTLKKVAYASVAPLLLSASQASAAINFGWSKVSDGISGTDKNETADSTIQVLVSNAMLFLGILAVLYGIYGGFLIMTANGEEDKVKKGKTILVQVGIGLLVIFIANSFVQWLLRRILVPAQTS